MTLWVVHTGGSLVREPYALKNECVVTVWEELPNPSRLTSMKELQKLMAEHYVKAGEETIVSWARQLWRFMHQIAVGDIVVMPRPESRQYAVGQVTGSYEYRADAPAHCRHVYPVKWIKTDLKRDEIEEDMFYSFKAHISFYQVSRNDIERRLLAKVNAREKVAKLV